MELFFKPIRLADIEIVLGMFKDAAEKISKKGVNHWQYWKQPPQAKIDWVKDGIQNDEFFFINSHSQAEIGMVRIMDEDLLYWGKQQKPAKYIHSLVVKDEYNGKGIGNKVIQAIENTAKQNHIHYLRLDADSNNTKLCQYYEKIGFVKVGVKEMPLSVNNLYEKEI